MDRRIFLCLTITSLIKTSAGDVCSIKNEGHCFYTIKCDNPSVFNTAPYCEYMDPYIRIVINKSPDHNITAHFFNTNYDSLVRIILGIQNNWIHLQNLAFSNFKRVLYIDFSDNNIKTLGSAFRGLEELDSLNLSRNHIEVINPGTFMISDRKNRLYLLDLSHNMLTFLSKEIFINLDNLRKLYLQGNNIITFNHKNSRYLKNLDYLNLCCNNLKMLNITMKYLKSLRQLNLSYNNIKSINVSGLTSLEIINLSHNDIEEFEFDNFEKSDYLRSVDLSYNKLKSLSSKKQQEVNYTHKDDIDKRFIKIDLNNNKISHLDGSLFLIFSHIHYLNLSNNEITKLNPDTFKHVKVMKVLSLSNCLLNLTVDTFKWLNTTEEIYLRHNNLTILDATFFKECAALKRIAADDNEIKNVNMQKFIKLVPTLHRITLKGNPEIGKQSGVNWVINKALGLVKEIRLLYVILIIFVIVGIKICFLYIRLHRRVVIVYALKCGRCMLLRYRFIK